MALAIAAALPGLLILLPLVVPIALVVAALSRGTAQLVCLAFLSPMAKAAAIAVVLAGLDVGSPLDALAVVPALELAALIPLTPGNVGVAERPRPARSTRRACRCRPPSRRASSCTPSRPPQA